MADRQKVLKGLECCVRSDVTGECPDECPYYDKCWVDEDLYVSLHKDIMELLKKQQEPVKPYLDFDGHDVWRCGNCHTTIFHIYELTDIGCEKNYAQYCRHCGRRVKWDDQKTQAEAHQEDHPMQGVLALEPDQHA